MDRARGKLRQSNAMLRKSRIDYLNGTMLVAVMITACKSARFHASIRMSRHSHNVIDRSDFHADRSQDHRWCAR
jgi:hypothetical protein